MAKMAVLDFLGNTVYKRPEPPIRSRSKPMEILCVGFPRSATESLQTALLKLGYDYTYHGWDILFEEPNYMEAWTRLAKKKFYGANDGESNLTRADFDAIIGHAVAITDTPAALFAAELVEAYPEAKVILNLRRDLDAWHRSADTALCETVNANWGIYLLCWFTARGFWTWMCSQRYLNPLLFRATDESESSLSKSVRRNGKWIYLEHCNMVRGMVPGDKLLEWDAKDGWEPLCKFLEKDVPDEPFPRTNNPAGFEKRVEIWMAENQRTVTRNLVLLGAVICLAVGLVWKFRPIRIPGL